MVGLDCFINSKVEMMKLELGKKKCHQIHVGRANPFCPVLQVHGEEIDLVEQDRYLGDDICSTIQGPTGSNQKNINKRKGTGMGVSNQIMLILKSVSVGHFYFEIAVILRESLLINSMCFNSEVWYAVTQAQVSELEEVDKMTMRKVLSASVSAPLESLHLELGTTPLKYIMKGRRVMFLHYLVSQKEEEMLSK